MNVKDKLAIMRVEKTKERKRQDWMAGMSDTAS